MATPDQAHDLECTCGKTLAKARISGLELYCPRCRRPVVEIPFKVLSGLRSLLDFMAEWRARARQRRH